MDKKRANELIEQASELVGDVEEPFKSVAFGVILGELLRTHGLPEPEKPRGTAHVESKAKLSPDRLTNLLQATFDWSSLPIPELGTLPQSLLILQTALEKFNIDGLSPNDIHQVLF